MRNNDVDVFKQLRLLIKEFKREDELVKEPKNYIIDSFSNEKKVFLWDMCNLLMCSNYTCIETKIYLWNSGYRYSDIVEKLYQRGKEKKENAVRQAIYRDRHKFENDFGINFYKKLIMDNSDDIQEYVDKYIEIISELKDERSLLEDIDLNFSKKKTHIVKELDDSKFSELLEKLRPYTKIEKEKVLGDISAESLGYLIYILNYHNLEDIDYQRLRQFRRLIGIE